VSGSTTTDTAKAWNRRAKGGIGWAVLLIVLVGLLAVGSTRDTGPQTQQDRIDAVAKRLACPTCDGESIYVSRAPAAEAIRNEVARQVATGVRTNDEIVAYVEERFGGQVLLVPRATGLDALVWALPAAVFVCAVAGLAVAFRRWKRAAGAVGDPTDADRALVADALRQEHELEHEQVSDEP
jgi:cytochrome c-type biogenesis protein CcmH